MNPEDIKEYLNQLHLQINEINEKIGKLEEKLNTLTLCYNITQFILVFCFLLFLVDIVISF